MQTAGDFVVIGSGIAGLRAAVELSEAGRVIVLTKAEPAEGNTGYAQGGIAAALGDDDSPELHAADTIKAGDGLCDEAAVAVLVHEGPRYVRELVTWGAEFDRAADGRLELGREGAHSVRRVVHAHDATGREIERTLWQRALARGRVDLLPHALVTGAIIEDGHCVGVRFQTTDGERGVALGGATLVATGGAGRVYRETTNPPVATGDGVSLAYRAGARVGDLEFVQFHPTVLDVPGVPRFLISEALRGEGAQLVNERGERFMTRYHPLAELAPRDVVARSIVLESQRTGGRAYLLLSHLDTAYVRSRFPVIAETCARAGIDIACDRIPVTPAANYVMGGVVTDVHGRTSIPGLYAAGEVACTGVHGANRLASNSLLEGLVFGARAGQAMRRDHAGLRMSRFAETTGQSRRWADVFPDRTPAAIVDEVNRLMSTSVGLFRDARGLAAAVDWFEAVWERLGPALFDGIDLGPAEWRATSVTVVGRLIARAANRREESRGAHFRADFPARDDLHWRIHLSETRDGVDRPDRPTSG